MRAWIADTFFHHPLARIITALLGTASLVLFVMISDRIDLNDWIFYLILTIPAISIIDAVREMWRGE